MLHITKKAPDFSRASSKPAPQGFERISSGQRFQTLQEALRADGNLWTGNGHEQKSHANPVSGAICERPTGLREPKAEQSDLCNKKASLFREALQRHKDSNLEMTESV